MLLLLNRWRGWPVRPIFLKRVTTALSNFTNACPPSLEKPRTPIYLAESLNALVNLLVLNVFYHAGIVFNHLLQKKNNCIYFIFYIVYEIMLLKTVCNII